VLSSWVGGNRLFVSDVHFSQIDANRMVALHVGLCRHAPVLSGAALPALFRFCVLGKNIARCRNIATVGERCCSFQNEVAELYRNLVMFNLLSH
jgi:hypothetical protein